jgi:hypothetical protein
MPARWRATSLGDQLDDHLASSASISAGDNSMPPLGNCSLTEGNYLCAASGRRTEDR